MLNLVAIGEFLGLVLIGSKIIGLKKYQTIIMGIIVCLIPAWWHNRLSSNTFIEITLLVIAWGSYLVLKSRAVKIGLLIFLVFFSVYLVLTNAGILNDGKLDLERTSWVDNRNQKVLERFSNESTFLPYRVRGVVWGKWWQGWDIVTKSLYGIGGDRLWPTTGVALWGLTMMGLVLGTNWQYLVVILAIVAAGTMARNPNLDMIGLYVLPAMICSCFGVLKKVKTKIVVTMILITIPFLL